MYNVEVWDYSSDEERLNVLIDKIKKSKKVVCLANYDTDMYVFGSDENSEEEAKFVAKCLNDFYNKE